MSLPMLTPPLKHPRIALLGLSLGFFIVLLDSTILNVALPAIEHDLHGSLESLQWTLNGYTLIFASLLLTGGALGDGYGVRKIFCLGLIIFIVTSAFCSLAPSTEVLIASRIIQGTGAALLMPATLSLIPHLFPQAEERARAIAIWSGTGSLGVACGPLIGGLLVGTFGWRSIFLVNLPFGIVALLLTLIAIPAIRPQQRRALDLPGQLCAMIACSSLTYSLIEWGHVAMPFDVTMFLIAMLAGGAFIAIEARSAHPMLPLQILRNRSVSTTMLVGLVYQFSFYGTLFVFALFFQQAYHYSALATGIAFLPQTVVCTGILLFLSRHLLRWFGPGRALAIGMLFGTVGMLVILLGIHTSFVVIACGEVLVGIYAGFAVSPLPTLVLNGVHKEQAGIASGSLNAARQIGGALGIALLGSALEGRSLVEGIQVALIMMGVACLIGFFLSISKGMSSARSASTSSFLEPL